MVDYLKSRWRTLGARYRRLIFLLPVVLVLAFAIRLAAQTGDTDSDGMSDAFELFFGLNPSNSADAAIDQDADAVSNLGESGPWSDPFAIDTDRDGWIDGWHDADPLSRAVMLWGSPKFTSTTNYDYTGPAWWIGGERTGGRWLTNAWYCAATDGVVGTELRIPINRPLLTNSLLMCLTYFDHPGGQLYVDLIRTNGLSTALNLYGNLIGGSSTLVTRTYVVPVTNDTQTAKIQLRRAWGEVTVYRTILYVDRDMDGLDDAQELQAGTDPLYTNGVQATLPGRIEAENFGPGGEGRGYHDLDTVNSGGAYRPAEGVDIEPTTDTGGGYNVGWARQGEWLAYTAVASNEGLYQLQLRVAQTESNALCHVEVDGINVSGPVRIPNTGGYQAWQTVPAGATYLGPGLHVVRLRMDAGSAGGGNGNFNFIDMTTLGLATTVLQKGVSPSAGFTGCRDSTLRQLDGATFAMQSLGKAQAFDPRWKNSEGSGIIWFDLASIPSNAVILSASLKLWFEPNEFDQNAGRLMMYPLHDPNNTGMWLENTNALYADYGADIVAGCSRYKRPNVIWSTNSDGRCSSVINTSEVRTAMRAIRQNQWLNVNVTPDIAAYVTNPSQYLGWFYNSEFDDTLRGQLFTGDAATASKRPVLEIVYGLTGAAGPTNVITALAVNGSPVTNALSVASEQDWYSFTAASTGAYTIIGSSITLPDQSYLVLYGPNSMSNSLGGALTQAVFTVTTPGTYYVRVSAWGGSATGTYSVRVLQAQPPYVTWVLLDNGAWSTPSNVVSLRHGGFGGPTEYMASESSNFTGGTWLPYATNTTYVLSTNPGVKTVYVKVRNAYWESQPGYDTIEYAPAQALTVNAAAVTGSLTFTYDQNWYTFTAASTGAYTIIGSSLTLTDQCYMVLYGPNSYTNQQGGAVTQAVYTLTSPGTYYFRLSAWQGSATGTYSVRVLQAQPPYVTWVLLDNGAWSTPSNVVSLRHGGFGGPTEYMASESSNFTGGTWLPYATNTTYTLSTNPGVKTVFVKVRNAYWESQPGYDTIEYAPAQALTVNAAAVTGSLTFTYDQNWYTFTAASTGAYTIIGSSLTLTDQCYMVLYGPNSYTNQQGGAVTQAVYTLTAPGTYYFRLSAWQGSATGTYSVRVLQAQPPYVTWVLLDNGAWSTPSNVVSLRHGGFGGPTEYMASESSNFTGGTWLPYATNTTYTLSTNPGVKTVFVKVRNAYWESQPGYDTIEYAPAQALTVNAAAVTGSLTFTYDQNWYTFTAASTGAYTIIGSSLTLTDQCYMVLYGPNSYTNQQGGAVTQAVYTLTAPGTYYFRLSAWQGSATGTYSVRVLQAQPPYVTWVLLDNGAWSTPSNVVSLRHGGFGGPTEYMASESSNFTGGTWLPYATNTTYTLSTNPGMKTVYVKVRNAYWESQPGYDTIEYAPAQALTVNAAAVTGSLTFTYDQNWYTFTAASTGAYTIIGSSLTLTDQCYMVLYGPNSYTNQQGGAVTQAVYTLTAPGTYYFRLSAWQGSATGTYSVRVLAAVLGSGLSSNLVGWWAFDEGAGTSASNSVAGGAGGTLMNMTPTWVTGKVGKALSFDGYDDYVQVGNSATMDGVQAGDYTLAAWVKPNRLPPGVDPAYNAAFGIVMKQGWHEGLEYFSNGTFQVHHWLTNDVWVGTSGVFHGPGTNYYVVGVVNRAAGTVKLYVNGALESTATFAANTSARAYGTMPWRIGVGGVPTTGNWGYPAEGTIDEVRMYSRALSDTDVGALFQASGGGTQTNQPPVVNAGTAQTITLPAAASLNGVVTDDGLPSNRVTVLWSKVSGSGTVSFASATSQITTASFSTNGVYVLQLAASDGLLGASGTVTITVNPLPNQPPVVNAGTNQTVFMPCAANLSGTVTDDGLPSNKVTVVWSKGSGPGTVTFGNTTSLVTTASFSTAGTYVLQLTANDGLLLSAGAVSIAVSNAPVSTNALVARWSFEQAAWTGAVGEVIDTSGSGNNGQAVNGAFPTNNGASGKGAGFDGVNDYITVPSSTTLQVNASMTLMFWVQPQNVGAGRFNPLDKNYGGEFALTIETNGRLSYYHGSSQASTNYWSLTALPTGKVVNTLWQHVAIVRDSVSNTVRAYYNGILVTQAIYSTAANLLPVKTASPVRMGMGYTAADLRGSLDEVAIYARNLSAPEIYSSYLATRPPNQAPYVNAKPDQTIVLPAAATLSGAASDDGLPSNQLTITWSKVSGTGAVAFASTTSLVTTASFSTAGVYVLSLVANDGALASTDTVQITALAQPTNVAPVIQTFTVNGSSNFHNEGSVTLNATATDANGDAISYQFTVQGSVLSAWSTNRVVTWSPGLTNSGAKTFVAYARDPFGLTNSLARTNYIFRTPPRP